MGQTARRWLAGLGTAAAVGVAVLGPVGVAGAAGTRPAARTRPAGGQVSSGQVGRAFLARYLLPGAVYVPAGRTLRLGEHGPAVRALQQRLNFLHYYPGSVNGYFGWDTLEAVWAFKEVQSGRRIPARPDIAGPAMRQELLTPRLPRVLFPAGGSPLRIEVNKDTEVLVLYRHGAVELISHVSTAAYCRPDGCGWVTPDGFYRALAFAAGWVTGSLGQMYNPVVFTPSGAFAIHGEPNPTSTTSSDGVR